MKFLCRVQDLGLAGLPGPENMFQQHRTWNCRCSELTLRWVRLRDGLYGLAILVDIITVSMCMSFFCRPACQYAMAWGLVLRCC